MNYLKLASASAYRNIGNRRRTAASLRAIDSLIGIAVILLVTGCAMKNDIILAMAACGAMIAVYLRILAFTSTFATLDRAPRLTLD